MDGAIEGVQSTGRFLRYMGMTGGLFVVGGGTRRELGAYIFSYASIHFWGTGNCPNTYVS